MKGIIYWHPGIYTLAMKVLYGSNFRDRYRKVADLVPEGAEVIDLCCGDCYIYSNFLKEKKVKYLGLDVNGTFIAAARKKGIAAEQLDLTRDRLPRSDHVLMQASLYHFIPSEAMVMEKVLAAALKRAIISEPVVNLSASGNIFISGISRIMTRAGTDHSNERFNKESLLELFDRFMVTALHEIEGGREIIGVFDKVRHERA